MPKLDKAQVIKAVVVLAGAGLSFAQSWIADKELKEKVAKEVANALKNQVRGSR